MEGEGLHQIPVGPVHAGIIEPGHFRFTCDGETVVRLEQRLGYVHKGIDALLHGAPIAARRALAGRISGDSTVAYAFAFARAVEAALGIDAPPRGGRLRGVMAELERIANHLGDFGAICNDASFSIMLAHCGVLRERVLRAAAACFGHRLMMDRIVPGGVAADLTRRRRRRRSRALVDGSARDASPRWWNCTTRPRRCRTAPSAPASCARSWRGSSAPAAMSAAPPAAISMRAATCGYAPYDTLTFDVPVLTRGRRQRPRLDPHHAKSSRAWR